MYALNASQISNIDRRGDILQNLQTQQNDFPQSAVTMSAHKYWTTQKQRVAKQSLDFDKNIW